MGKWFYTGNVMPDGTKKSVYACDKVQIEECIEKGWEEVKEKKEEKKEDKKPKRKDK